jgi:acetate kinase
MSEKFKQLAKEATERKAFSLRDDNGLTGYATVPHDLYRRLVPIAREYAKGNADIVLVYTYLLSNVNGQRENDRYMSAFTSVDRIAADTGIGRNRIAKLSNVLEAVGLLKTAYDYTSNKRDKLYYPMYYSGLTDEQIRQNLDDLYQIDTSITVQ